MLQGLLDIDAVTHAVASTSTSSLRVTGSGTQDLVHFADSVDWNLAAGNFTIECFINPVTLVAEFKNLVSQWGSSGTGWALWLNGDQLTWVVSTTGANVLIDIVSASSIVTLGSWFHVCVDFDGIKYRMYIETTPGTATMVGSSTTLRTIFDSANALSLGGDFEQLLKFFNGYMQAVRITKGVARYASDSGFVVPTVPFPTSFPADPFFASTVLLMPFQGVNGSTGSPGMDDYSLSAHGTATVNGAAAISTAQHK